MFGELDFGSYFWTEIPPEVIIYGIISGDFRLIRAIGEIISFSALGD